MTFPTDQQLQDAARKPGATFGKLWKQWPNVSLDFLRSADKRLGLGLQRKPAGKAYKAGGVACPKSALPRTGRDRKAGKGASDG